MKKTIILLGLIFHFCFSQAQESQSTIIYNYKILNPMPSVVADSLFYAGVGNLKEGTQTYYYKDNRFKNILKETGKVELYDPRTVRLYVFNKYKFDTVYFTDVSKSKIEILEISKLEKKDTVLGHICSIFKIKTNLGSYYYSYVEGVVNLNPEHYSNYKNGPWYDYLKASNGSIP